MNAPMGGNGPAGGNAPPMMMPMPGGTGAGPQTPPGPTGPATVAPQSNGLTMRGRILVAKAILPAMTQALSLLGATSPEGETLIKAMGLLSKSFGDASSDLGHQEIKMLASQAPAVSQPTLQNMEAFQQAIQQKLGALGLGGRAPRPHRPTLPQEVPHERTAWHRRSGRLPDS